MTTQMSITSITDGQRKQYKRFVEDAADKALVEVRLDKDGLQNLIERGDEFQLHIITGIRELSTPNQFADEEIESSYGYLSGYKPRGITEQTNCLRELFSGIGYADEKLASQPLPLNAEGWFAIPRWEKLAPTYGGAVEKVFTMIKETRKGKFVNYRKGQLGPKYLRQHAKTVKAFQTLGEQQKDYDILVIPAQFGFRHRGRSVRRAWEVMNVSEFGLGTFAVGIMLLTHPERLQHYDDLWIDCAGDKFAPDAAGQFVDAPYLNFYDGEVQFYTYRVSDFYADDGSASGFLPQS